MVNPLHTNFLLANPSPAPLVLSSPAFSALCLRLHLLLLLLLLLQSVTHQCRTPGGGS